ncbi:pseudouridine synthase [Polychaeton citri CBS 116435]|uniref:tRNA pseudouridine synthase 1 n=1 Tax=Polychaeton citri CBS 116435 TaxID=1314669 RepID=A0A9P4UMC4_9PEZI|nr:pseudouridine synthase [Polychaeton citri CBS 116435]
MEHSAAIMQDADRAIDNAVAASNQSPSNDSNKKRKVSSDAGTESINNETADERSGKKHKRDFKDDGLRFGSKGRGGARGNDRGNKSRSMGRTEYFKSHVDKRQRIDETRAKHVGRKGNKIGEGEDDGGDEVVGLKDNPIYATLFPKDEIEAEEKRPKRKVAVMVGYSGTGYKGMQLSASERTIEGDLFLAFVKAGAISKVNADDPKKTSLVRCARTDKGVHAAGNMISLKLIIEDDDIVSKINSHLSPQIRVWGIERTIGSFSCYQACDSRWYEYLIPSHSFLPPHPSSWMAHKCEEHAKEVCDLEAFNERQQEVEGFWEKVEAEQIKPIIDSLDEDIRFEVVRALQGEEEAQAKAAKMDADVKDDAPVKGGGSLKQSAVAKDEISEGLTEDAAIIINEPDAAQQPKAEASANGSGQDADSASTAQAEGQDGEPTDTQPTPNGKEDQQQSSERKATVVSAEYDRIRRLRDATKRLRTAYIAAKRCYRIPSRRVERIQEALDKYIGTKNYHNFTVQKTFRDPSSKRNIKSFVVNSRPILIGDGPDEQKTEWLSLKVHGQSFMMHQIRKMVGMVALLVRYGSDIPKVMNQALTTADRFSIPKVPGLGLLLERPVFDSYNRIQAVKHDREKLDFDKFDAAIEEFKHREIYERIFREEEESNQFSRFFNHIDNFKEPYFLFVTSKGHAATIDTAAPMEKVDA